MTLRRAYQIAHMVTATLTITGHGSASPAAAHHLLPSSSITEARCSVTSVSSRAHTQRAKLHSNNACFQESWAPQIVQELCAAMFLLYRTSPVGKECRNSLHKKTRIFEGISSFQIPSHSFCSALVSDPDAECSKKAVVCSL